MLRSWPVIFVPAWLLACGPSVAPVPPGASLPVDSHEPLAESFDSSVDLGLVDLRRPDPVDPESTRGGILVGRSALLRCFAELVGDITLTLELDTAGRVVGGSTEPAGGQEGLSAVADCVLDLARTWQLPVDSRATSTIVRMELVVGPASDPTEALDPATSVEE